MNRSFTPSHLILAAVALLVGLALGGLVPQGESRELRNRIAELESRECDGNSSRMGQQIVEAFRNRAAPSRPPIAQRTAPEPKAAPEPPSGASEGASRGTAERVVLGEEPGSFQASERFDEISDAMEIRRAQSRQALVEQADLSTDQLDEIDVVLDEMNADLEGLAGEFVATVQGTDGPPDRRESMLFARETIDVLLDGEDGLWQTLSPEQQANVDPEVLDPFNYIDGGVIEALRELDP